MSDQPAFSDLSIPASPLFLEPTLALVESLALSAGFETDEALSLRLALEETVGNIMEHGYPDAPGGRIDLRCELLNSGLRVTVHEKGLPYDPQSIAVFDPEKADLDGEFKGLGTMLVRHAVDEVQHRNLGREGRQVILTKHMKARHVARLLQLERPRPAEPTAGPEPAVERAHSLRPFRPEDALEVCRCAYLTYGYTYEDYIYYPERIVAMNAEGTLLSVVAVSDDGRFMGHGAAKREDPRCPLYELGVLQVAPGFRGCGVAGRLMDAMIARARQAGATSGCGRAVVGHTVSQRLCEQKGMRSCALQLGAFPRGVEFKRLAGVIADRMGCLTLWMPLREHAPRRIYPPERHRSWVERLYGALGLELADTDRVQAPEPGIGQVESRHTDILNIGEVFVHACGPTSRAEALRCLRQLCVQGAEAVYFFLNLEDPGAPAMSEALERQGCFFAGIFPDKLAGRDALVLQYLNQPPPSYENIRLESPDAQALLEYVRSQDPGQGGPGARTPA